MATNQVNINLSLQDQSRSIKQRTDEVKGLNKELQKTQSLATGTRTGSAAVSASYSAAGENIEYGRSRGAMGSTGAAGRDFANQAQGLGGLVRLYATYAANVFAVSAAFSALSEAMNTSMMIRGLDQLGAASGLALGGIAKQFANASEGAISLREAMEATAKATSSGLSKKQFMELGAVAKGASQALGVNMSDAVSRLTRGITKLEPELLDELGIFTKVGKATEEYARSVGKSADSLTDFEKRQAFANAVLAEGRQKFGEIASETNPYDKLLANLKNVAQDILSTINTIVGPIAKIFADSTALIGLAIGVIALKITKQALPALASWREGLTKAATDAAKSAQDINTSFGEAFVERAQQRAKVPQLQEQENAEKLAYTQRAKQFLNEENQLKKNSALSQTIASGQIMTTRQLGALQAEITKKQNDTNAATQKHVEGLKAVQSMQLQMRKTAQDIVDANTAVEKAANTKSRMLSEEWQREKIVQQERAKAARLTLVAGVGERVSKEGLVDGFSGFYSDTMANKDLGKIDKFKTVTSGAFVAVGQAASILGRSLRGALVYLEIAVALFSIFSYAFSKNGKEVDKFKSSVDDLSESLKTANDVSKKFGTIISTDSINARANAFTNLTEGVKTLTSNLENSLRAASTWDIGVDFIKRLWGGDLSSQFTESLSGSISGAIKATPEGQLKNELEEKLSKVLNIKSFSVESIEAALSNIPTSKLANFAKQISSVLDESDKVLKKAQAVTQDVKETGKAANDAFLAFSTSTFGSTPLQTFLIATTKNVFSVKNALESTLGAAVEFKNVLSGATKLDFMPAEQAAELQSIAKAYTDIQLLQQSQLTNLDRTKSRISEIVGELNTSYTAENTGRLQREKAELEKQLPKIQLDVVGTERALKEKAKEAGEVMGVAVGKQLDLIFQQTTLKLKQLNIGFQQQVLNTLPVKTEESIREQSRLAIDAINVELQLRKSNENLINSIDLLRVQMEVNAANERLRFAEAETGPGRAALLLEATTAQEKATNKLSALRSGNIAELKKYAADDPGVLKTAMNRENSRVLDKEAQDKKQLEIMKRETALMELSFANSKEALEYEIKSREEKLRLLKTTEGVVGNEARIKAEEEATFKAIQPFQRALDMLPAAQQTAQVGIAQKFGVSSAIAASQTSKISTTEGRRAEVAGVKSTAEGIATEQASILAQAKQLTADITVQEELKAAASTNAFNIQKESIAASREQLSYAQTVGALTQQEIAAKTKLLSIEEAEVERRQKLSEIDKQRFLDLLAYSDKVTEAGGVETVELERQLALIQAKATFSSAAAEREYQARLKTADITASLASKQTQYETVFKNSFEGMADAIVEFAKTGKLSFKDLTNTMLTELLRIELRMQMSQIWSAIRPGFGNIFSSIFGSAQGSVYDGGGGLQKFAKGGMFTNSVVNSPTLFKFAKGTGLMGEAGPEAIMPLKRDSSGNLGVRSSGSETKVDVVVINNSGEKAETRETTDSRGNRKIEVMIGDMTAGEISRSGSASQRSIRSTFGIQPQLIRR